MILYVKLSFFDVFDQKTHLKQSTVKYVQKNLSNNLWQDSLLMKLPLVQSTLSSWIANLSEKI